ncbi:MAG: hypothetical protein N3A72_06095 [bacterium]|nr:hypothetical protein [bacterium]
MKLFTIIQVLLLLVSLNIAGYAQVHPLPPPTQPAPVPPRYIPKPSPIVPADKPMPIDLAQLQKVYQDLRTERDRLEKEIDIAVGNIRQLKNDLRNTDNPVSKFFYRRQLETQFAAFREKVEQLELVEERLTGIIREFGKRISLEPTGIQPTPPLRPIPFQNQPSPLRPDFSSERTFDPEPVVIPPDFDHWPRIEKTKYLQQQIQRITAEKKQLETAIHQYQTDLAKLRKLLDQEANPKSETLNANEFLERDAAPSSRNPHP